MKNQFPHNFIFLSQIIKSEKLELNASIIRPWCIFLKQYFHMEIIIHCFRHKFSQIIFFLIYVLLLRDKEED